jgi:hypothetical protein
VGLTLLLVLISIHGNRFNCISIRGATLHLHLWESVGKSFHYVAYFRSIISKPTATPILISLAHFHKEPLAYLGLPKLKFSLVSNGENDPHSKAIKCVSLQDPPLSLDCKLFRFPYDGYEESRKRPIFVNLSRIPTPFLVKTTFFFLLENTL